MQKYLAENRDLYYTLAKNNGYRARSAYKLLQINDYLNVLNKDIKYAVDLCAAPGSWSQVLHNILPADSKIVSVDLAPIAPISKNVHLLQGDITT